MIQESPFLTPPWSLPKIIVCGEILEYIKQDFTPDQMINIFCNHLRHHANSWKIFTDGSQTESGIGFAAVGEHWRLSHRIQAFATVFTAKLCASRASMEYCRDTHAPSITLITDSRSSFEALVKYNISNPLVNSIQLWLATLNKPVYLCWVPSNTGLFWSSVTLWYFYFEVSKIKIYMNTKTNGAFHTFIRIITIILVNVTSFSSNDTAQTRSETLANLNLFS